jgi:amino acid permease
MVPAAIQTDLAALQLVTPVSICALSLVAVFIACLAPGLYSAHAGDPAYGTVKPFILSTDLLDGLPLSVFAFSCHLNVIPVAGAMVRPTDTRIKKVSWRVHAFQFIPYAFLGIAGHLSWLDQTPQNILLNYDAGLTPMIISRVILSFTMCCAIPINEVTTVRSFLAVYRNVFPANLPAGAAPRGLHITIALVCLTCQAVFAVMVPGVVSVISVLGATICTVIMMIIPAFCSGKMLPRTPKNLATQIILYGVGLVTFAAVPAKLMRDLGFF